jgi:integrase
VEHDRLAVLWWLIALRGLRPGDAAALDRDDLDAEARELTISRQLVALPGELYCGPPKSRAVIEGDPVRAVLERQRGSFRGQLHADAELLRLQRPPGREFLPGQPCGKTEVVLDP